MRDSTGLLQGPLDGGMIGSNELGGDQSCLIISYVLGAIVFVGVLYTGKEPIGINEDANCWEAGGAMLLKDEPELLTLIDMFVVLCELVVSV